LLEGHAGRFLHVQKGNSLIRLRSESIARGEIDSGDVEKAPTGLRAPGKALWAAVASKYVLTAGELEVLRQAVRTADEVDRLEKAVRALPDLITTGSTGQPRAHPLLSEVRWQQWNDARFQWLLDHPWQTLNGPDVIDVIFQT
jgi:hypothetical protein